MKIKLGENLKCSIKDMLEVWRKEKGGERRILTHILRKNRIMLTKNKEKLVSQILFSLSILHPAESISNWGRKKEEMENYK